MASLVQYWLLVISDSVDGVPHDVDPALGRLHGEEGDDTGGGRVEVQVWIDPFTAVIQAVPFVLD